MLKNDTDVDRDGLRAIRTSGPKHGSLTLNGPGSFVYEPKDGYAGKDSFTYGAIDGEARSEPVTVEIQVEARCTITGTGGNDVLHGTGRDDVICGLGGNDVIHGKAGDDVLIGRAGKGRVVGGTGKDEERQ